MARKCGHCREEGHTQRTCPVKNAAPEPETQTAPEPNPSSVNAEEASSEPTGQAFSRSREEEPTPDPAEECTHGDGFRLKDGISRCVTCDHPDTAAAKLARYRAKHHAPDCDCPACKPASEPADPVPTCSECDEPVCEPGALRCEHHIRCSELSRCSDCWEEPVSVPAPTVPDMETTPEPDQFSDPTPGVRFDYSSRVPISEIEKGAPQFPEFSDPTPVKVPRTQTNRRGYLAKDPTIGDYRRYQNGNIKPITRVSTFVKAGSDRTALTDWNMRNVLLGAVHFPQIAAQAKILHPNPEGPLPEDKDTKQALDRIVDQVAERVGSKRAANRGTAVHDSIERVGKGLATLNDIPTDHVPWVRAYLECLEANGLEILPDMIEGTVFVPQFGGVMGRFDQCVRETATGKVKMSDIKTGELDYAWNEIQGQLAMYVAGYAQHGTYRWDEDDPAMDEWIPPRYTLDADEGIVFHLPVKHGEPKCEPKRVDLRAGWEHVKRCAMNRETAANRPKPEPYVPATVPAPEPERHGYEDYDGVVWTHPGRVEDCPLPECRPVVPSQAPAFDPSTLIVRNWRQEFQWARGKEHLASLYEQAAAAGVGPVELQLLVQVGTMRLTALANGAPLYPYSTPEPPF